MLSFKIDVALENFQLLSGAFVREIERKRKFTEANVAKISKIKN